MSPKWRVIDAGSLPFPIPSASRKEIIDRLAKEYKTIEDIPEGSLGSVTSMPLHEQIFVMLVYLACLGIPLAMVPVTMFLAMFVQSKIPLIAYLSTLFIMAAYPMKQDDREGWIPSRLLHLLYKYSSYKVIYPVTQMPTKPCIGSGGPHGVFPIGSLLSIPAINDFLGVNFRGGMASVVAKTPALRSLTSCGCTDVSKKNIVREITKNGATVGIVSDGINGIFAGALDGKNVETLAIEDKKGIAKLALEQGIDVNIVHWLGNSDVLVPLVDPFGIMKGLSRKLKMSVFLFTGRFLLPIPTRAPILMAFGVPVVVPRKIEKPTQAQIDELHGRICEAHKRAFDAVKRAYGHGYGDKDLLVCK